MLSPNRCLSSLNDYHRDAVSGGGYCMIGTIISADMDLIGQLQPNTPTHFVQVNLETALQARVERSAVLAALRESYLES